MRVAAIDKYRHHLRNRLGLLGSFVTGVV